MAKGEAILLAVALSMKADMPSGPLVLLVTRPLIRLLQEILLHPHMWIGQNKDIAKSSVRGCSAEFQRMHSASLPFLYHLRL